MDLNRRQFFSKGLAAGGTGLGAGIIGGQSLVTPASAQPVMASFGGFSGILAQDLGVKENSRSDQTRVLQKAIFKAAASRKPLYLPAGRIKTKGLTLPDHCHLIGVADNTELSFQGGSALLHCKNASQLHLHGLTLTGNGLRVRTALVHLRHIKKLTLSHCVINHSYKNGLGLYNCGGSISNTQCHDIRETGLFAQDSTGLEISHNHVHHCANNGIQVWRSKSGHDGTVVTQNRISHIASKNGGSGQYGNGINIFRADDVMVSNNHISHCKFTAVRDNSSSNCQITNNHCMHMGEVAIFVEFAFQGAIVSNNLIDDAATGISVTNFNDGGRLATVSGNLIRNIKKQPLENTNSAGISIEADCIVSNNVIENSIHNGISVGWGKYVRDIVVSSNLIRHCRVGIAVAADRRGGSVAINNNIISQTAKGAIRASDHNRYLGTDLAHNSSKKYPNFSILNNVANG